MALLEIRKLSVSYGPVEAVRSVDMDVQEGCITAIIGSNGAGKTTIINAISGVVRKSGTISFNGEELPSRSNRVVRKGIIQVPEGRKIFAGLSVEDNLRLGAYIRKDSELQELLEQQYALFPILGERRKQDAGTLSGGEQQMLAISRGLMGRPKLLMLDEPSLGLAPIIVATVFETIERIKKEGTTILLVEQNANMALKNSTVGYVMENGSIVLSAPSSELLVNEKVKKAYLGT